MVTNSGGITTATIYNPELGAGVPSHELESSSSPWRAPPTLARTTELASLQRGGGSYGGRGDQILELVVAAVTVVAEIVTLALSRATAQEKPLARQPVRLPGAPRPSLPVAAPVVSQPSSSVEGENGLRRSEVTEVILVFGRTMDISCVPTPLEGVGVSRLQGARRRG